MFIEIKARGNERGGKEGKEGRKTGGWKKDEGRKRRGKEGRKGRKRLHSRRRQQSIMKLPSALLL